MICSLQWYFMKNSRNIPEKEKNILISKIFAILYWVSYNYIIEILKLISKKVQLYKEFCIISAFKIF